MTEAKETNIFLAIVPPAGEEIHVKWRGHTNKESAEKEMAMIRKLMVNQRKKPYDCYIYEGEAPLYGLKAYELDDVDMNFYDTFFTLICENKHLRFTF